MKTFKAPDVKSLLSDIVEKELFPHVDLARVYCMRSEGSKSRAYARIWSFPSIWQNAMGLESRYVIEVLSEHFDKLHIDHKYRVLIHELMHIPKNFSGSLLPHKGRHCKINGKTVEAKYKEFIGKA